MKTAQKTPGKTTGKTTVKTAAVKTNGSAVEIPDAVRARIIEEYEVNGPSAKLKEWFQKFRDGECDWTGVAPMRLNVGLHLCEWVELIQIAKEKDWTIEQAVDELLYRGIQNHVHEEHRKATWDEYRGGIERPKQVEQAQAAITKANGKAS